MQASTGLYTDTWRNLSLAITCYERDAQDVAGSGYSCYGGTLTNTETGVVVPVEYRWGSMHEQPSCLHVAALYADYPEHVFIDGYPEHGLEPFSERDVTHISQNPWCESLGYDPDDEKSRASYAYWVIQAALAVTVMDDETRQLARESGL